MQNFIGNTEINPVCVRLDMCFYHYLPEKLVNQWLASTKSQRSPPIKHTHRVHTYTLRSAHHNLLKHAVTAVRQRGSAPNNTGVDRRAAERSLLHLHNTGFQV